MEATVTPTNEASRRLFKGFGRKVGAEVAIKEDFFSEADFPAGSAHEAEGLFRIGPYAFPAAAE